ncbi:MAG: hypothetical protein JWO62_2937, partial [Acidimicrobiaceae bacterium]|nr:hypothetical protein [Acidimicrobiaceae bacterium]
MFDLETTVLAATGARVRSLRVKLEAEGLVEPHKITLPERCIGTED